MSNRRRIINDRLYAHLTAIDISDLRPDEVSWKKGRITRKRSKTRDSSEKVPTVTYQLWPETLRLLREFRDHTREVASKKGIEYETVLLTDRGTPICTRTEQGSGRNDSVRLAFNRLKEKLGVDGAFLSLKKTSATLLEHEYDLDVAQLFLGHSPRTVAQKNYVAGDDTRLDAPLTWLKGEYGLDEKPS